MNLIFTDEPLAALAFAEAVGELPRPLNLRGPEWAAAMRLMRGLLAGRPWPGPEGRGASRRLGPNLAVFRVSDDGTDVLVSVTLYLRGRPGRTVRSGGMSRTVLGDDTDPGASVLIYFHVASPRGAPYDELTIGLRARAGEFLSDLQALIQEIREAREAEG